MDEEKIDEEFVDEEADDEDIYSEEGMEELEESDEINPEEEAFMKGYNEPKKKKKEEDEEEVE